MILRIGICDDMQKDIDWLYDHIQHYMLSYNVQFEIECFLSGEKLLYAHKQHPFHILLLDIEMPKLSGMTIARYLRNEAYDDVFIVFVTSYPEYMRESFDVQPFQFLSKPVSYPTIEKLLSDIIRRYKHSHTTKIVIDNQGKEHLVPVNDILFIHTIKGEKRYLEYHLATTKLRGEGTIQEWEERLKNQGFCSPYRGYLINIRHVKMVQNTAVLMSNGISLPVSRRKVNQLQQLFANRIIHTLN